MPELHSDLPPAVFLMGPTASGKTALAVELVKQAPFEIISVDSALVYTGMDIGTAKPDAETLASAPHRLISFLDPALSYSAGEFRRDALQAMADITAAGKIPLLVGGTMLYFKALKEGIAQLPTSDPDIRSAITEQAAQQGWPALHQALAEVDPVTAARLQPADSQRISRALEVYRISGKPLSVWHQEQSLNTLPYRLCELAITTTERSLLHERIAVRFRDMLAAGFADEVRALMARDDLNPELPAIRAVGYRQMWDCLLGKISYPEMEDRGIIATRQLAKRQLTWLRGWGDMHWLYSEQPDNVQKALNILRTERILPELNG